MSIFFVLPAGLGMGLYLGKREDGFPLTTGGNDPVEEDGCYQRGSLPPDTCGNSPQKDRHDAKLNRFW
jgi:hypothetical protein